MNNRFRDAKLVNYPEKTCLFIFFNEPFSNISFEFRIFFVSLQITNKNNLQLWQTKDH